MVRTSELGNEVFADDGDICEDLAGAFEVDEFCDVVD